MVKQVEITVRVTPAGETTVEAGGFEGPGCLLDVQDVAKAVGATVEERKKPEFHRTATRKQVIGR